MPVLHRLIAAEISAIVRHYDRIVQCGRIEGDDGALLDAIDCRNKSFAGDLPDLTNDAERAAVLLNATLNHHDDIQQLLAAMWPKLARTSRIVVVAYNPYLQWLYRIALVLGLKRGVMPTTFITITDLDNLCRLAHFQRTRARPVGYIPWRLLGIGSLVNRILPTIPLIRHLALTSIIVLRPLRKTSEAPRSISVVIPARNERGNIEPALARMPDLGCDTEVVFVEGHSTDGTWDEIERVCAAYGGRFRMRALQQTGKGKADAVRLGFASATGDLVTILDADLTMPPELLPRFIDAYRDGAADFINGNRSIYPMEGGAMRFLNRVGNVFFAKALTWVLDTRIGDSLCGTKLMRRDDYVRMTEWRRAFGEFDPFGDFELLFPAAVMALGIIDVPIRYRSRTYGTTQISRFTHGLQLLRMTIVGTLRIKLGRIPPWR